MPQYTYQGRDKDGHAKTGTRTAASIDSLNNELLKEGIFAIRITEAMQTISWRDTLQNWLQKDSLHRDELAIFSRQMKLLHQAGVPMVTALKQLAEHTHSKRLELALLGVSEQLEKGTSLANAMQQYPTIFTPLIVNIIRIGENTGQLDKSFEHVHRYLEFEASNIKQIKTAFRYPTFVLISMLAAIIILNIFVIPSFGKFYSNLSVALPWQTQLLIGMSNIVMHYGIYLAIAMAVLGIYFYRYLKTSTGRLRWDTLLLRAPIIGKLLKRIILIRFSQSLSIMLSSGLSVTQALQLVKDIVINSVIANQIAAMQSALERGTPLTQTLSQVDLFTPLEIQILGVGEKNGELSPALTYIANFHSQEIEFDLKHMSDLIGPILIAVISGIILIIALGVYLPIWNMINLVHA